MNVIITFLTHICSGYSSGAQAWQAQAHDQSRSESHAPRQPSKSSCSLHAALVRLPLTTRNGHAWHCVHIHAHARVRADTCACTFAHTHARSQHANLHPRADAFTCACSRTCMCTCQRVRVCAGKRVGVFMQLHMCVLEHVRYTIAIVLTKGAIAHRHSCRLAHAYSHMCCQAVTVTCTHR